MKIPLTKGYFAIIDEEDFPLIKPYKWCYSMGYAISYAGGGRKNARFIRMHRLINNTPDDMITDHINGNKLDNRKSNLRNANKSQNAANSKVRIDNTSGYRGIWRDKTRDKWAVDIHVMGKKKYLGRYNKLSDAISAYENHAKEVFGEFARVS